MTSFPFLRIARLRTLLPMALLFACVAVPASAAVRVFTSTHATPRERFGAARVQTALQGVVPPVAGAKVVVAVRSSPILSQYHLAQFWPGASEAFLLRRVGNTWIVAGSDPSGVLYGSLELASRIHAAHGLPAELNFEDHPSLKLRGVCIGMQKTEILYDGAEYDYRYTPKNFPFFYDKAGWIRYLNFLADNRMNTLYLWNGHPFTSLLKLHRYPEAQELPTAQLNANIAMFHWLTKEADKRGIWIVQGFYNIHLSHAFARAHGLPNHLRAPTPLASEYTRYAISQFIKNYPNVGLLVTLGEAMAPKYGPEWMSKTIIPGVKDGLRELGTTAEPPIVIRAHATDIDDVMKQSMPLYKNIDTMEKWNGESLVWFNVRGKVRKEDEKLADESSVNIANVHLLSNLEPFRWGDPDFIRKTVLNFQKIGIGGLHLYPLRFWDWPYTADNTKPRLLQIDRDWIWFEAWARYAWNPNRDPVAEHAYWVNKIGERYGSREAGEKLLEAYEDSGICAPELLPRIGVTEGNREAFSLGLLMPQLLDPKRYGAIPPLWEDDGPPGERLSDYVAKEVDHQPHEGQTPIGVAAEVTESSEAAVKAAEEAGAFVTRNRAEYERLLNDMRCIHTLMEYYNAKTQAAEQVLLYGYDHKITHLDRAELLLAQSVDSFKHLVELTNTTYLQACSLHTDHRTIPFVGGPDRYTHWRDALPAYEKELAVFRQRIAWLKQASPETEAPGTLSQIHFEITSGSDGQMFTVAPGAKLYTDSSASITALAPELNGLQGVRISRDKAAEGSVPLTLTLDQPGRLLVGFFKSGSEHHPPAGPQGNSWTLEMINAVQATGNPALSVWSRALPAGKSVLDFGRGAYIVLGVVAPDTHLSPKISFFSGSDGQQPNLDWLFED